MSNMQPGLDEAAGPSPSSRPPSTSFQTAGVCTWCGHPPHGAACPESFPMPTEPSRGRRKVPTRIAACPCMRMGV
jgi:hypothetical protein